VVCASILRLSSAIFFWIWQDAARYAWATHSFWFVRVGCKVWPGVRYWFSFTLEDRDAWLTKVRWQSVEVRIEHFAGRVGLRYFRCDVNTTQIAYSSWQFETFALWRRIQTSFAFVRLPMRVLSSRVVFFVFVHFFYMASSRKPNCTSSLHEECKTFTRAV
jgi:hypothetical protein